MSDDPVLEALRRAGVDWPVPQAKRRGSSNYSGVFNRSPRKGWSVVLTLDGHHHRRGTFATEREAALARESLALELGISRRPVPDEAEGIARIPLTQGRWALVDLADLHIVAAHLWCAAEVRHGYWYAYTTDPTRRRSQIAMHQMVLGLNADLGEWADHRNGDGLDNRRSNVRKADRTRNNRNRRAFGATSSYIGVSRKAGRTPSEHPKWEVHLHVDGRGTYVGRYEGEEEAARAYDAAAYARDPEFARLNFPDDYGR